MSLKMVLYYWDLLFGLYPTSLCILTTTLTVTHSQIFAQMECMASVLGTQYPPIEASSIDRTQQSRFHLMTREEPSLETLWLKNIRTMDKVQIIDRCKTILDWLRKKTI
jgi:hypothetical protein